jgi:cytochrome c oxidase cbb3-type subunit III
LKLILEHSNLKSQISNLKSQISNLPNPLDRQRGISMQLKALIIASLLLIASGGCDLQSAELAPAGASPLLKTPIGPIPGPEKQVTLTANPYSQDPKAIAEGKRLFNWYNCAGCHGGRAGGGMGPSLRDGAWISGGSDAHIFNSIADGRANGMPAWGSKLPEEQIWKIVAYIKSMRTPLEPEPPTP